MRPYRQGYSMYNVRNRGHAFKECFHNGNARCVPTANPKAIPIPDLGTDEERTATMYESSSEEPEVTPITDIGDDINETAVQGQPGPEQVQNLGPVVTPEAGGLLCFPAHALVELKDGLSVPISDLRIGDRVRTGNDSFSDVLRFSHCDVNVYAKFVHLFTSSGHRLVLTPSHYLYSNGKLTVAGTVNVGDELILGNGSTAKVVSTKMIIAKGLYNPHTLDGNIVVDGAITSTCTTSVDPILAHGGLLAPLRAMYHLTGTSNILDKIGAFVVRYAAHLSCIVPTGPMTALRKSNIYETKELRVSGSFLVFKENMLYTDRMLLHFNKLGSQTS